MNTQKEQVQPSVPKDYIEGLKENFSADFISGFIIFLLALPLSLGIAKASEVPPIMGLVTAIIGGIVVSLLSGSKITIKGPAAGLIVIVAGCVQAFGGGEQGWKLALGAMFVAGLFQILFGVLKMGKYVDVFPLAAIHGMLAAIGLIIIAKQIPILLNVDPAMTKGHGPLTLLSEIPIFITHMNPSVGVLGITCLAIMMYWPKIKHPFIKKIPASLVVLILAIPVGVWLNLKSGPAYNLVKVGNILDNIAINLSFEGLSQPGVFIKYVIMFALVGSLESLLTVKAIDIMDPFKRKSDTNKDLIAIGVGNTLASVIGGIPMISEVARSSANVNNGAKTRWANFFHGAFLLLFAIAAYPLLEMIPNAALAAMLISVGIKLAHPKELVHTYHIGFEQLIIFLVTVFVTLFEDLLMGVVAGMIVKLVFHIFRGVPIRSVFKAPVELTRPNENTYLLHIHDAAIFCNYLGIKKKIDAIPNGKHIIIEFCQDMRLVDHSAMENFELFKHDYEALGGTVTFNGMNDLIPFSKHPLAGRRRTSIIA